MTESYQNYNDDKIRLSDHILSALQVALKQEDVKISEILVQALELSMTRKTGGGEFVERRQYPVAVEKAMNMLYELKQKEKNNS